MRAIDFILETLAHFTKLEGSPPPGIPVHAGRDFERELVLLCGSHGIGPIILDSLEKLTLDPELSRIAVQKLKALSKAIEERNRRIEGLAEMVGEALENRGVPSLLMGGLAFASLLYPSLSLRPIERIELLAREEDWGSIGEVFRGLDFEQPICVPEFHNKEEALSYHQYITPCVFRNRSGDLIHIRFRIFDCGPPEHDEPAWSRCERVRDGCASFGTIDREDALICSVMQWNMTGFATLVYLVDIGLILSRYGESIDWGYVASRLNRRGGYRGFYSSLKYAADLLEIAWTSGDLPRPGRLRQKAFEALWRPGKDQFSRPEKAKTHKLRFYLLECEPMSGRMAHIKKLLRPDPEWVSAFFGRPSKVSLTMRFAAMALSGRMDAGLLSHASGKKACWYE